MLAKAASRPSPIVLGVLRRAASRRNCAAWLVAIAGGILVTGAAGGPLGERDLAARSGEFEENEQNPTPGPEVFLSAAAVQAARMSS